MDAKIISSSAGGAQGLAQQRPNKSNPLVTQKATAQNETPEKSAGSNALPAKAIESQKIQTEKEIDELVDRLNTQSLTSSHTLRFSIDEKLGKAIISVVDRETDEVIRQIPPETALQIAEAFEEVTSGQLLTELA